MQDNGLLGEFEIIFSELDRMPVISKTVVKDDIEQDTSDSDADSEDVKGLEVLKTGGSTNGVIRVLRRLFSSEVGGDKEGTGSKEAAAAVTTMPQPLQDAPPNLPCSLLSDDAKMEPDEQSCFEGGSSCFEKEEGGLQQKVEQLRSFSAAAVAPSLPSRVAFSPACPPVGAPPVPLTAPEEVVMYHLKKDVRDKQGRLQGVAELQVTVRGAGVAEFSERKKAMVSVLSHYYS